MADEERGATERTLVEQALVGSADTTAGVADESAGGSCAVTADVAVRDEKCVAAGTTTGAAAAVAAAVAAQESGGATGITDSSSAAAAEVEDEEGAAAAAVEARHQRRHGSFERGQHVEVQGLKGRPELNGQTGKLVRFDVALGRWHLKLQDEIIKIKPENICAAEPLVLPLRGAFPAVGAAGPRLYVLGGNDGEAVLPLLEDFDPTTSKWTTLQRMPESRSAFAAVVVRGKVYAIGGSGIGTRDTLKSAAVFDPSNYSWTDLPWMSTCRLGLAAAVVDEKIYALGGDDGNGAMASVEVFDTVAGVWSAGTPMQAPRTGAAGVIHGKIYAIGGDIITEKFMSIEVFDVAADSWALQPSSNTKCRSDGFAAATVDEKIYLMGGCHQDGDTGPSVVRASVDVFDSATSTWAALPPMLSPRWQFGAAVVEGRIFVFGGYDYAREDNWVLNSAEVFDPVTLAWSELPAMGDIRGGLAAVFV